MIEFTKDGQIKNFSVPDAHTLYVTAYLMTTEGPKQKPVRKEAITLPSLDSLDGLDTLVDKQDGMVVGRKWAITPQIIKDLKSKGSASHYIPGHPLRFDYYLRKVKHSDNLKHKG